MLNCLCCNQQLLTKRKSAKFCNMTCQHEHKRRQNILDWENGKRTGSKRASGHRNRPQLSIWLRNHLLKKFDFKCQECSFNTPHPDGRSILQIDHIDGDPFNDLEDNLRPLCPNCHAITETYGARNTWRR